MKRRDLLKAGAAVAAYAGTLPARATTSGAAPSGLPVGAAAVPPTAHPAVAARPLSAGLERDLLPKLPLRLAGKSNGTVISPMSLRERERRALVPRRGVCSIAPGKPFRDTLLSGNGAMYLELTGAPYGEQVLFHHERLMLPWRRPFEAPKVAGKLPAIRKLLMDGKYREGVNLAFEALNQGGLPVNLKSHPTIPAFGMQIDIPGAPNAQDYLRTVDFESGEIKVAWRDSRGEWLRRTFVSHPDNIAVQELRGPRGRPISATIALQEPTLGRHDGPVTFDQAGDVDHLLLTGRFDPSVNNNGYAGVVRVVRTGGTARREGNKLVIENAESVLLLTRIAWFADFTPEQVDALVAGVAALAPDYDGMLARNRARQAVIINRVALDLGGTAQRAWSGEELLEDQRTRADYAPALLERIFDMGRYWLLLSCGEFPVQPIGGEVNININLQVAHGAMGDMPEAMASYFNWIESLLPDCRKNAANIFGTRGAVYPILPNKDMGVSFHYATTEGAGIWPHPYWISAGGWVYSPFWDHYLVTGDTRFLRDRVVPGLKELALFYEDFLSIQDERGNYVFVPSFSPENWPLNAQPLNPDPWPLMVYDAYHMAPPVPFVINSAMDVMVCREVLTHLIEACEILGSDSDSLPKWKAMLAKMPPYRTTEDGTLKEWGWPGLDENYDQRHVSHLYGAWPSDEIDPRRTPELARAALLADRKRGPANTSAHGLCHRALAAARLKDSFLVDWEIKQLLNQGYFNETLRSAHNPYNGPMPDAQGGLPTIMMEMLCYSRPGVIELLPALPSEMRRGSLSGMRSRSFARIDLLRWDLDARTIELRLTSLRPQTINLVAWHGLDSISASSGALGQREGDSCELRLPEGQQMVVNLRLASDRPRRWALPRVA
jgi:alpha-L-fucosidase 2